MKRTMAVLGLLLLVAGGAACSDDDASPTTTVTSDPPGSSVPITTGTTQPAPDTTQPPSETTQDQPDPDPDGPDTTIPGPEPGSPCEPGTDDCVEDAWGDGVARYIVGYDECAAAVGDGGICTDLDQDGFSGYPDSG